MVSCERHKFRQTMKLVYNHAQKNLITDAYQGD